MVRRRSTFQQAFQVGAVAAAREHRRLDTDPNRRVDVFNIIERAGIWLMFQPLKNLYGVYARSGESVGIIINANHPLSLQRFTAAHEYGHHILGHGPSFDEAKEIQSFDQSLDLQEASAQAFASHFLMPLELVNRLLRAMGLEIEPEQLTPQQVYLLSLELGVSYRAAVSHLMAIRKIDRARARMLREYAPKEIKHDLGRNEGPEDPWADVWPLERQDSGREIHPRVNDEVHIWLPAIPSSGYIWTVENSDDRAFVQIGETVEPAAQTAENGQIGAEMLHHIVLRITAPGRRALRLVKQRPWQPGAQPREIFQIIVDVTPNHTGDSDRGLSEPQKLLLIPAA